MGNVSQAAAIKAAIASITTCNSATVANLQHLLSADPVCGQDQSAAAQAGKQRNGNKGAIKTSAPRTTRGKDTKAAAAASTDNAALSAKERYKLATEIVNVTLKILTDSLKSQFKPACRAPRSNDELPVISGGPTKPGCALMSSSSPLSINSSKERPLRELVNPPGKVSRVRRTSSYCSSAGILGPPAGLVAIAECSRLAFSFLRTVSPGVLGVGARPLPPLQVESGMMALIGRMLAHGMESLAIKESKILKRRLERHANCDGGEPMATKSLQERETLASLISLDICEPSNELLPLLVNFQLQSLKIICNQKRPATVEAVVEVLDPSNHKSPAWLLLNSAEKTGEVTKAARQLDTLASMVLSLCPSASASADPVALNAKLSPSPSAVFRLQAIALRIRQCWWRIANHEVKMDTELYEPLAKYLDAYLRRSSSSAESYKLASSIVKTVLPLPGQHDQRKGSASRLFTIYKAMSLLAQTAAMPEEALQWVQEMNNGETATGVQKTICAVRETTLQLEKSSQANGVVEHQLLRDCQETMGIEIQGLPPQVELLLAEVAGLRKAIVKRLAASSKETTIGESAAEKLLLCETLFECSRLLATLATKTSCREPNYQVPATLKQLIEKLARPFIDSTLFVSKLWMSSPGHGLQQIKEGLQTCSHLAALLSDATFRSSTLVNISNVYWLCHVRADQSPEPDELLSNDCLHNSINLLTTASPLAQEAGFLAMKLEKLGTIFKSSGRLESACDQFRQAVEIHIDLGVLHDIAQAANRMSSVAALEINDKARVFARLINMLHRAAVKTVNVSAVYNDSNLPLMESMALLECQLSLFEASAARPVKNETYHEDFRRLMRALLDGYTADQHPLRRARISSRILTCARRMAGMVDGALVKDALDCTMSTEQLGDDKGLRRFARHVAASLTFAKAYHATIPSQVEVTMALQTWQSMVEAASSWPDLEASLDDPDTLITSLQTASSYLILQSANETCLSITHLLCAMHRLRGPPKSSDLVQSLTDLSLQYLRVGTMSKSKEALLEAEGVVHRSDVTVQAKLSYHASHALVSLACGDVKHAFPAVNHLVSKLVAEKLDRLSTYRRFADAAHLYSMCHLASGSPIKALEQAKKSVRLYQSLLAFVDRSRMIRKPVDSVVSDPDVDDLVDGIKELAVIDNHPTDSANAKSGMLTDSASWEFVPELLDSLLHLSSMYAYVGLRPEAEYYLSQAAQLAQDTGSPNMALKVRTLRISHACLTGSSIDEPEGAAGQYQGLDGIDSFAHLVARGDFFTQARQWELALAEFEGAEKLMARLLGTVSEVSTHREIPNIGKCSVLRANKATSTRPTGRKATAAPGAKVSRAPSNRKPVVPTSQATIQKSGHAQATAEGSEDFSTRLRQNLLRHKALVLLKKGDLHSAVKLLDQCEATAVNADCSTKQAIAVARSDLLSMAEQLSADVTYNVLPESTISLPALAGFDRRQSRLGQRRSSLVSPPQKPMVKSLNTSKAQKSQQGKNYTTALSLRNAGDRVTDAVAKAGVSSSVASIHEICGLASTVTIHLSAMNASGLPKGALHPLRAGCSMELPSIEALQREIEAVALEKQISALEDVAAAPSMFEEPLSTSLSAARFQKDYIDIIPNSWTVLSLGLNEDCTEFYITCYHSGQTPFLLRLPMARHKVNDIEQETIFDFEAAKTELHEIVDLSNYSCHHAPDTSIPGAKTSWWEEREALDHRMHELLSNIENMWLGGFKGILSQHQRQPSVLARFRKSFENILDRHLPSRQGSKASNKKLSLDSNVLELFVGLGDDKDGAIDLDEHILDLLYFVIDILQFNGERNAYDEVDFDSMTIETLDAMRAYHESTGIVETGDKHMILVLDKRLHSFPWESLPCLEGVSASRVGSMLHLRERILAMRQQQASRGNFDKEMQDDRATISPASGTYILNPSGDLTGTQATLEPYLTSLSNHAGNTVSDSSATPWTSLVRKQPSESAFTSALTTSNILLYFGHGSGNQYVRSRAIRKLDTCAPVVWLIGCSSGAVTEAGSLQPVSVPLSYLVAGSGDARRSGDPVADNSERKPFGRTGLCMAVVATLWDVTDKDIDRLSVRVGEEWGLWSPTSASATALGSASVDAVPKTPAKRGRAAPKTPKTPAARSRSRAVAGGKNGGGSAPAVSAIVVEKRSLVEAVRKGREACYLRYLNGAAAVVYGVPVYLGE